MKKMFALLACAFAMVLSGCSTGNGKIKHEGKYYLKEFYVDVLGTEGGVQYVDYTKRYSKSACVDGGDEQYDSFCSLLLEDNFYLDVTTSTMATYKDGEKLATQYYVLRDDYVFYTKDNATDSNMYESGYFIEKGMIRSEEGPGNSIIHMVFEKK